MYFIKYVYGYSDIAIFYKRQAVVISLLRANHIDSITLTASTVPSRGVQVKL